MALRGRHAFMVHRSAFSVEIPGHCVRLVHHSLGEGGSRGIQNIQKILKNNQDFSTHKRLLYSVQGTAFGGQLSKEISLNPIP